MAADAKLAAAFVEGKGRLNSSEVVAMWVEQQPDRILFRGMNSGGFFRARQMPPNAELQIRAPHGPLGRVKKTDEMSGMRFSPAVRHR